jgi:ribosomal protein S18 acetylase RimI-like enzyme
MIVQDVTPANLDEVCAFLESHLETSIFLLYCLEAFGPRLGERRDSGNFRCVMEGGRLVAVACSTRRGDLLVQTGGRSDLGPDVLRAYDGDPVRIDGVIAEWEAAASVWPLLCAREGFRARYQAEQIVYSPTGVLTPAPLEADERVRPLGADDFDVWHPLFHALEVEEGAELHGDRDQVRQWFSKAPSRWWGIFGGDALTGVACVEAGYHGAGHVGGVYVRPEDRGRGMGRRLLVRLLAHGRTTGQLLRPIFIVRVENQPARRFFESLSCAAVGRFGFLLGGWTGTQPN